MVVGFGEVWEEEEEEIKEMEEENPPASASCGRQGAIRALIRALALVWDAVVRSGALIISVLPHTTAHTSACARMGHAVVRF